mmetsp:Transcript_51945/g.138488  ORF Transcript_51945/g.138488 Transcript_51945/m.138488 type:complete len:96 (+) Transcript_51945:550-837(+)
MHGPTQPLQLQNLIPFINEEVPIVFWVHVDRLHTQLLQFISETAKGMSDDSNADFLASLEDWSITKSLDWFEQNAANRKSHHKKETHPRKRHHSG